MASKPPAMSSSQKAGGSVASCPNKSKSARRRAAKKANANNKPCDIRQITVGLTTKSGGVTLNGTTPKAVPKPLRDVSTELNALLASNAVVIHYVAPAVNEGLKGKTIASAAMKSTCGAHPVPARDPADGEGTPTSMTLDLDTADWSLPQIFSCLWGEGSLGDLIFGAQAAVTYTFDSCGRPAGGNPVGDLSGVVQLAMADEWAMEFRWAEGFHLTFSGKTSHIHDRRDGTRVVEHSHDYKDKWGNASENEFVEVKEKGKTTYRKENDDEFAKGKAKSAEADVRRRESAKEKEDEDDENSLASRLERAGDKQEKLSLKKGLGLSIKRNDKEMLDTDGSLGDTIDEIQEMLKSGSELLYRLTRLLERGARAGLPVSLTMAIELDVGLLQGIVRARAWPEALPVKQAGTYYLADYRKRFEIGLKGNFIKAALTFTVTLQANVIHEWVASAKLEIEVQFEGESGVDITFASLTEKPDVKAGGPIEASIKVSGEGSAASFYFIVEGEAKGGIEHEFTCDWNKLRMVNRRHHVTSDEVTLRATVRRGNKIWDFIGMGSGKPSWQWPEDEPFVWLEAGALDKTW